MQNTKRVEIIISSAAQKEILRIIDQLQLEGYSLIRDVTGKGHRGTQMGDELSDVNTNIYLLAAISGGKEIQFTEALRPLLKKYGGICLLSDAVFVKH